ncbi:MAG TPA: hypothetical protein VFH27_07945 [Longimicrobiaceae bacterium]|nr:hypothetical protein [Longimicrobiaceae bacterium]
MTIFRSALRAAAAAALLSAAAAPAGAQSLLSARGLGFPLEPYDARAVALGGIPLGLPGRNLSLVNPAEDAALPAPALAFAFQPESFSGTAGGSSSDARSQRYPLVHAAFPFRRFVASVGYGSYLDQHWGTSASDSTSIGGTRYEVVDRFSSSGGVSRLRLSAGYRVTDRLMVGAGTDLYTGQARDSSIHTVTGLSSNVFATNWSYTGVGYTAGARFSPADPVWLSASVSTGTTLRAKPDADSGSIARAYDLPLRVDAGVSGRIGGTTTLALAGSWKRWSSAEAALAESSGGARDVRSGAAGLEYEGFKLGTRVVPLRLGAHYTELPFQWDSKSAARAFPVERGVSGGLGIRLLGGAALGDAALERGKRGGSGTQFDESYWRMSFSLTLLGR